jgi:hypothetical protein
MSKIRGVTGGGAEMNKVVHSTNGQKVEPRSNAVSPGAVSRQGCKVGVGTPRETLYQKRGFEPPAPPAQQAGRPGSSRAVYSSGSQSRHSSPTGPETSSGNNGFFKRP